MRLLTHLTVFAFACAGGAVAQSGIVKSNGLPIPGATVTAIQGGRKTVTTTDENGRYDFSSLTPGTYTFEVQMFGFRVERREAQVPGQLDWTLQIMQRTDQAALRARTAQANQAEAEINNEIAAAAAPASRSLFGKCQRVISGERQYQPGSAERPHRCSAGSRLRS